MDDQEKRAISSTQAGMRLVAQLMFYNQNNETRLRQFIQESYSASELEQEGTEERLTALLSQFDALGRQKLKQLLATSKHHVVVALEAEKGGFYYCELACEDDYPHKITRFLHHPLVATDDSQEA